MELKEEVAQLKERVVLLEELIALKEKVRELEFRLKMLEPVAPAPIYIPVPNTPQPEYPWYQPQWVPYSPQPWTGDPLPDGYIVVTSASTAGGTN